MAKLESDPKLEKILRKRLSELLTEGLVASNVADNAGELLELQIVASKLELDADADEEAQEAAYAAALTAVLMEAVVKKRIPRGKHRRILRYVLPLKDEYLGTTIRERRIAAGEHLTDGKKIVAPGTIRTYKEYEPGALDALATVLVKMEAEYHREISRSASHAD
jgi:hypothetical protein